MGLVVFGEVGCTGPSKELTDSVVDVELVAHTGVPLHIKSAIITGNPWLFYSEAKYQGFFMCAEEGRYDDLTEFPRLVSVKYKNVKMGLPHIKLFSKATLSAIGSWWTISDAKVLSLSVGEAGLWITTTDHKVYYRDGTGFGKGFSGTGWTMVEGDMKQVSVGNGSVWGVTSTNQVMLKPKMTPDNPTGAEWQQMATSDVKMSSVNRCGGCWSLDMDGKVFVRAGARLNNPIGSKWQLITGKMLKHVSNGDSGVWGITLENEIVYRDGTFGREEDGEGAGWTKVDGRFIWLSSGINIVWALTEQGNLWFRAGISAANPIGNNWYRLDLGPDQDVNWNQVECYDNEILGLDMENVIIGRSGMAQQIIEGSQASVYEATDKFTFLTVDQPAASCCVESGGWVIYSQTGFAGTKIFHFPDETVSNDPLVVGDSMLKSWEQPIGSVRPIFGEDFRPIEVQVDMDWNRMEVVMEDELLMEVEDKNPTTDYMPPTAWTVVKPLSVKVDHRFSLLKPAPEIENSMFYVTDLPKGNFHLGNGHYATNNGKINGKHHNPGKQAKEAKSDFRQEISGAFTFSSATEARRSRTRLEHLNMFPKLPPLTKIKVKVICEKAMVTIPFTVNLTQGIKSWKVNGVYKGVDVTKFILDSQEFSLKEC